MDVEGERDEESSDDGGTRTFGRALGELTFDLRHLSSVLPPLQREYRGRQDHQPIGLHAAGLVPEELEPSEVPAARTGGAGFSSQREL